MMADGMVQTARPHKKNARPWPRWKKTFFNQQHVNADMKVHILGYPTYVQEADIISLFSRNNVDVQVENMTRQMATVIFASPEEAQQAIELSERLCLYGTSLTVKQYNPRNDPAEGRNHRSLRNNRNNAMNFPKSKQKGEIIDPSMIDLSGPFEDQLEQILANVRLTQQEAASLGRLYADVEMVLRESWPGCVALPFGSITTGLGLKTSDADCFVLLPPAYRQSYPHDYFVPRAKRLLQTRPDLFTEILCIPRANTPIVKFFHLPTGTNCDVSFKTLLGVQNSKLIGFLLHTDPRILPLAIIIRYWAKVHELSGSGRLTNYALTLLVIFYLQQPKRPLLPPVEWLQRNRADDFPVDGWNTGFSADYTRLSRTTNTMSLGELLGGFFKFYSQFDFEQMVVCPYLGYALYKTQFAGEAELSDHFALYVRNVREGTSAPLKCTTAMCVQDPLELSHNVASSVNYKHYAHMQAFFKLAAEAYEADEANGCNEFLKTILLTKPEVVQKISHPEYRMDLYPNLFGNAVGDWRFKLWEMLITIFEKILKTPLHSIEGGIAPCGKREKQRYEGTITCAVWKRKPFYRLYNFMRLDFLERESRITDEIINVTRQELNLRFGLTMSYRLGTRSVGIHIRLVDGDQDMFKQFGNFFHYVLPDWFKRLAQYDLRGVELREPTEVERWGERPAGVSSMGVHSRAVRDAEKLEGERATQFRMVRDAESACVRRWEEMRKLRDSIEAIALTDPFDVVD